MKRVLALLLMVMLCVVVFASCGTTEEEPPHVHTFAETWTSDASGHWYAATCECEDVLEMKLAHADKNNDGACDVCEYKMACANGHTYAEEWTVDCTNHWHVADCGHIVAGTGVAAHADGNNDGKCDVCNYVIRDIHTHYFDKAWSSDASYHWHAALCEHGVEVADKAAHEVDATGYCTVCGAKVRDIDKTDITAILNAAVASNGKVVDGSVLAEQIIYSGSGNDMYVSAYLGNNVYFVLGNGSSYIYWKTLDENGDFMGAAENWYDLVGEEEVFAVERQHADYLISPVEGTLNHLNGYSYYPGSILPSADDDTSTLANTLSAIYALSAAGNRVSNATENFENGVYSFAFTYYTVDKSNMSDGSVVYQVEVYNVEAEFTVDENFVIDNCNLTVSVYRNIEQDMDLDYNPDTDVYTLRADANPSVYKYEVSQRSGERTYTNPYPKDSLIPVDFDIYTADVVDEVDEDGVAYEKVTVTGKVEESITVDADSFLYLALRDIKPSTAFTSFIDFSDLEISFVNKTAGDEGVLFVAGEYNPSYSKTNGYLAIFVKDAGTYTLTIKFGDVVKTFDVVVEEVVIDVPVVGADEMLVQTTDTYAWIDEYKLVATKGEGKYTLTIPAGLGFWSKAKRDANPWVAPEVDFYDNENGATVVVELEADAEFAFYVGAIPEASWVISYTYEACEVDGGSQGGGSQSGTPLAIGTTQINAANAVYVYTAASDGTLTLTAGASIAGAVEISYTKNGGDSVVLELSSTVELALVTGDTVVITVVAEGYSSITADWSGASSNPDPITSIAGTYTATDIWGNALTVVITDTTITFTPPRSPEVVLEYEYDGETVAIYSNGVLVTNPLGGAITAEGAVATTLSYNGTDYTLTVATGGGDQGGDDPQPSLPALNVGANNVTLNEEEAVSGKTYSFAVTEEGTYTFAGDLLAIVLDSTGMQVGRSSVYLAVGNYTVILVNIAEAAGDFVVTVNFQAPATGDEEGDGSEGDPYVWTELPGSVTINSDTINKIYYLYTATEDGTLTFTWVSGDSWGDWFEMDGNNTTANNGGSNMSTTMVIAVEAGKTYRIGLGTFDNAGEFEITVSFVAGSGNEGGEGDGGDDEIVVDRYLYDGFENEIEVTADDKAAGKFYLYFTPDNDGEYEFASGFLFVSAVTLEGTPIEKNNMGKYVLESYVQYVLEISTNYISEAGSYTLTPEYTYPEGHQENPFWYTLGESATASYKNDYSIIWYQFCANATGTLTVTNLSQYANVELLVTAVFGSEKSSVEFDEETFESIYNGSVSLDVIKGRQYFIGISGAEIGAEAEIEFSASIEEGEITVDGTKNLPYAVVIGENEANVEFGEEVCFYYTFTAAGTLTLVTSSDNYSWYYAEDLGTYVDAMLENTLVINGYEGYTVYIAVNTADWSSAVIPFSASFEADPVEVYYEGAIINDGSAANEIVIEDNTYVVITVYGAGQYIITWDNEEALVAIVSWMGNTPIANGDMIEGSKWGGVDLMIYLPDYAEGTVNVTITPYIAPSQDLALGDNTISVTDTTNGNSVTFTATEAGTYNLNVGENTVLIYDNSFYFAGDVLPVTLLAGESVSFNIATEDYSMSDVVLNIAVGVEGGEGEATVITDSFKYVPDVYSYRWVLEFNADGTGVLKEQEFGSDLKWAVLSSTEFTYTYDGTDVTIDFADDAPCEDGSYQVGAYYIFNVVFEGQEVSFEIM